jgi:hypothetical protein
VDGSLNGLQTRSACLTLERVPLPFQHGWHALDLRDLGIDAALGVVAVTVRPIPAPAGPDSDVCVAYEPRNARKATE